jgi:hypothetical protein
VPNDEEVFITREREKIKRAEFRRVQSARPIWQKNTAASNAPLQKVRDEDIKPMERDPDAPTYSYTAAQRGFI